MATSDPSDIDQRQRLREAGVNADEAGLNASAALVAADRATTIAGGMITRSPDEPSGEGVADGAMWIQSVAGEIKGTWQWDAGAETWGDPQKTDPTLIASAIIGLLAAGVIDSTEVTIKSGDTGDRLELLGNVISMYNSAGTKTVELGGTDGHLNATNVSLQGSITNQSGSYYAQTQAGSMVVGLGRPAPDPPSTISIGSWGITNTQAQIQFGASNRFGYVGITGTKMQIAGGAAAVSVELFTYSDINLVAGSGNVNLNGDPLTASAGSSTIHSDRLPIVPVAKGGTGQTTLALARNAMGLGNTTSAVPVANGGTGATTAAAARAALSVPLIQNGVVNVVLSASSTGTAAITFPTAYSSAPTVQVSMVGTPSGGGGLVPRVASGITGSGATIVVANASGAAVTVTIAVQWTAIG